MPYAAKTAIYEILGPPGTTGVVNWMDAEAQPQKAGQPDAPLRPKGFVKDLDVDGG
jgi:hypothetical protein